MRCWGHKDGEAQSLPPGATYSGRARQVINDHNTIQPEEHTGEGSKGARKCMPQGALVKTASQALSARSWFSRSGWGPRCSNANWFLCRAEAAGTRTTLWWHCSRVKVHNHGPFCTLGTLARLVICLVVIMGQGCCDWYQDAAKHPTMHRTVLLPQNRITQPTMSIELKGSNSSRPRHLNSMPQFHYRQNGSDKCLSHNGVPKIQQVYVCKVLRTGPGTW